MRSYHDDDDGSYKPSPYPISILPKVSISRPRPKHVHTVDVPPTPLDVHGDDNTNEERNIDNGDLARKYAGAKIIEGSTTTATATATDEQTQHDGDLNYLSSHSVVTV